MRTSIFQRVSFFWVQNEQFAKLLAFRSNTYIIMVHEWCLMTFPCSIYIRGCPCTYCFMSLTQIYSKSRMLEIGWWLQGWSVVTFWLPVTAHPSGWFCIPYYFFQFFFRDSRESVVIIYRVILKIIGSLIPMEFLDYVILMNPEKNLGKNIKNSLNY